MTNIAPYLPEGFTLAQFKALLLKYILKEENVQPYVFSAEELAEVEKIKRERYDKWEWNYGFSPSYSVEKSRRFEGCGKIEVHMNTEDGSITEREIKLALRNLDSLLQVIYSGGLPEMIHFMEEKV